MAPLVVVAVAGLALAIGVRGGKALYTAEREVAEHERRLAYLGETMLGRDAAAERTLFGASSMLTGMWRVIFKTALGIRFRARLKWYLNAYAGNLTNQLIWIGLMLLLLTPLQAGAVSIGLFIALTQAFTKFDIVWGFMDTVNGLAADAEFFKDLSTFLALQEEGELSSAAHAGTSEVTVSSDNTQRSNDLHRSPRAFPLPSALLELRDVRFRYPGTQRLILDGLDLRLSRASIMPWSAPMAAAKPP